MGFGHHARLPAQQTQDRIAERCSRCKRSAFSKNPSQQEDHATLPDDTPRVFVDPGYKLSASQGYGVSQASPADRYIESSNASIV